MLRFGGIFSNEKNKNDFEYTSSPADKKYGANELKIGDVRHKHLTQIIIKVKLF